MEHGWTRVRRMHADRSSPTVLPYITTETQRMGRNRVAAVRRNVVRPWGLAAHRVAGAITPYGVTGNVVLVILAVSLRSLSQGRWQLEL